MRRPRSSSPPACISNSPAIPASLAPAFVAEKTAYRRDVPPAARGDLGVVTPGRRWRRQQRCRRLSRFLSPVTPAKAGVPGRAACTLHVALDSGFRRNDDRRDRAPLGTCRTAPNASSQEGPLPRRRSQWATSPTRPLMPNFLGPAPQALSAQRKARVPARPKAVRTAWRRPHFSMRRRVSGPAESIAVACRARLVGMITIRV